MNNPKNEHAAGRPEMAVVVMAVGAPPELTRAVSSIIAQNVAVEWVVVNSGGGDVQARMPAGGGGGKVLSFEKILGPGAARNKGIEATTAPYIAFLAADCVADEDWVEARLRHHRAGARMVASSVVNNAPGNLVAWASHLAVYGTRLPGTPVHLALRYGVSFHRELFRQHGLFEDIRIGEDTEFIFRIGKPDEPVWAPEVRTVHQNPTSILAAWRDQYQRGVRSGTYWPQKHSGFLPLRFRRRFRGIVEAMRKATSGRDRVMAAASLPLLTVHVLLFELGGGRGILLADPVVVQDGKARTAEKSRRWQTALEEWTKADVLAPGRVASCLGRGRALVKLQRYPEAGAVFTHVRQQWPRFLAGHEGAATVAAKTGKWEDLLEVWEGVERLMPGLFSAREGRGTALLELARTDEAEAVFRGLLDDFPNRPQGYKGLARVAMARLDWELELKLYESLWERFGDADAIRKKIGLLVGLGRMPEAGKILESLISGNAAPIAQVRAAVSYFMARQDWATMIRVFEKHRTLLSGNFSLLHRYINILSMLGRAGESLPVIERCRLEKAPRRLLRITALILDRRYDEAHVEMKALWTGNEIGELPVALLPSLVNAALMEGGPELATEVLDRIGKEGNQSAAGETLRLTCVFHRARLMSLSAVSSLPARLHVPDPPLEAEVRGILASQVRTSRLADRDVGEACDMWMELRRTHPAFFPDPSFVLKDALELAMHIADAIDSRKPFSLVRLGDGEGNFLPYRETLVRFVVPDRSAMQHAWWGRIAMSEEQVGGVVEELHGAIRSADVLGIADLHRISRSLGNGQMSALSGPAKNARGLHATIEFVSRLDVPECKQAAKARILTSCHVHESFAYWGLWDLLIPRMGVVSVITCHAKLRGVLENSYGVKVQDFYLIPGESKYSRTFNNPLVEKHYPDFFENLRGQLSRMKRGQVFLVAAGMLGKIYCKWIKDAGGIALDVGSAVDFWCGYETRGLDEASCYRGPKGMAEHFKNLAAADPRIGRLLAGAGRD